MQQVLADVAAPVRSGEVGRELVERRAVLGIAAAEQGQPAERRDVAAGVFAGAAAPRAVLATSRDQVAADAVVEGHGLGIAGRLQQVDRADGGQFDPQLEGLVAAADAQ